MSETNLERTFLAVGSLGRWEYLLHASCFLVFSDIVLVLGRGVSIDGVSLDWLRVNASLGTVLVVVLGYSFTKSFLLPAFDLLYFVLCVFPLLSRRIRTLSQYEVGIHSWLSYSLLTRNAPAYRELERVRAKNIALEESSNHCRHLALFLFADFWVGMYKKTSFICDFFAFTASLQGGQRYLFSIPLLLFVLVLGYNALLIPLSMRVSISVKNDALMNEIRRTTEVRVAPEIEEEEDD